MHIHGALWLRGQHPWGRFPWTLPQCPWSLEVSPWRSSWWLAIEVNIPSGAFVCFDPWMPKKPKFGYEHFSKASFSRRTLFYFLIFLPLSSSKALRHLEQTNQYYYICNYLDMDLEVVGTLTKWMLQNLLLRKNIYITRSMKWIYWIFPSPYDTLTLSQLYILKSIFFYKGKWCGGE